MKTVKRLLFGIAVFALMLALVSCGRIFGAFGDGFSGGGDEKECEHVWKEKEREAPTCTNDGFSHRVCGECGEWERVNLPATGHTPEECAEIPATCTEPGVSSGTVCSTCGATLSGVEVIHPLGHSMVTLEGTPSSCIEEGLSEGSSCERCGMVYDEQHVIAPTGHSIVYDYGYDPTCTEDGVTTREYCYWCGTVFAEAEVIPSTGHISVEVEEEGYAPTCTEAGLTDKEFCYACWTVVKEHEEIAPLGHKIVKDAPTSATCKNEGLTGKVYCESCETVLQEATVIASLGHHFETGTCDCGLVASVGLSYVLNAPQDGYIVNGIGSFTGRELVIPNVYEGKPVVEIAAGAFRAQTEISSVIVTGNIERIGEGAFADCTSLVRVELSASVVAVEKNVFDGCLLLSVVNCADFDQTLTWEKDCFGASTPSIRAQEKGGMTPYEVFLYAMAHVHNNMDRYRMRQDYVITSTVNGSAFPDGTSKYSTVTEAAGPYAMYQYNGNSGEYVWITDGYCYYRNASNSYKWKVGQEYVRELMMNSANSMPTYTESFFKGAEFLKNADGTYTLTLMMNEENMAEMVNSVVGEAPFENAYFEFCEYVYHFDADGYIVSVQADAEYVIPDFAIVAVYDIATTFSEVGTLQTLTQPTGSFQDISRTNCYCTESMEVTVPGTPATCIEDGMSDGVYCKNCFADKVLSSKLNAKGHRFENGVCTECEALENASAGLLYEFNADGLTCTVAGIGTCTDPYVIIPERIYGVSVVGIEAHAFKGCNRITGIEIPVTVTTVGEGAFDGCTSLSTLGLPYALRSLLPTDIKEVVLLDGEYITATDFSGFTELSKITLPKTLTGIADGAFADCEKILIVVNNSSLPILAGEEGFGGVARNAIEVIGRGEKSRHVVVGDFLFEEDSRLEGYFMRKYLGTDTEVFVHGIPNGEIFGIYCDAFENCDFIETLVFSDAYNGCNTVRGGVISLLGLTGVREAKGTSWLMMLVLRETKTPCTVTVTSIDTIRDNCFSGAVMLEHLIVLSDVKSIGNYAFRGCTSLVSVTLPERMDSIGSSAFADCSALTEIVVPNGITSLYDTFSGCTSLRSVTLPDGLLEMAAFSGCTALTAIELPASLQRIGGYAFKNSGISTLTIPAGSYVENYAFSDCSIRSLTVLENTSFSNYAFERCGVIELINRSGVDLSGMISPFVTHSEEESLLFCVDGYYFCEKDGEIYLVAYDGEDTVIEFPQLPDGRSYTISTSDFQNNSKVTRIIMGKQITGITTAAFSGCTSVTEIYYNASIVDFEGWELFSNCGARDENYRGTVILTIGKDVREIPGYLFKSAPFKELHFEEESVCTRIGDHAFDGASLEWVELPPSLQTVEGCAFLESPITELIVRSEGLSISNQAFSLSGYRSKRILSVTIGKEVKAFPSHLFNIVTLTALTFEDGCRIGAIGQLYEQTRLESLVLPEGIEQIGDNAFSDCSALVSITLPASIEKIGADSLPDTLQTVYYAGTEEEWAAVIRNINPTDITWEVVFTSSNS